MAGREGVNTSGRTFLHLQQQGTRKMMLKRSQGGLKEELVLNKDPVRGEGKGLYQHRGRHEWD